MVNVAMLAMLSLLAVLRKPPSARRQDLSPCTFFVRPRNQTQLTLLARECCKSPEITESPCGIPPLSSSHWRHLEVFERHNFDGTHCRWFCGIMYSWYGRRRQR